MIINDSKKKPPFGLFTLVLVGVALAFVLVEQILPKSSCDQLKGQLKQGYFMQWLGDGMLIVTADKQQFHIAAQSEDEACQGFLADLNERKDNGN